MSSALKAWYVDPSTGTNLRFWNGTTWTDEVAPMPYEPVHSSEVDHFSTAAVSETATQPDTVFEPETVPEPDTVFEPDAVAQPGTEAQPGGESGNPDLDPEIEQTQLTRRELRARRGADADLNDAPKHLPPIAPPPAVSIAGWQEPVEEVEIPAVPVSVLAGPEPELEPSEDPVQRRRRIVRMSMLLGILAVVSSVAVLTAGTL